MDPRLRGEPPPREALTAWGVGTAEPLPGGQGGTYRAGDVVLKPVIDEAEAAWLAGMLAGVPEPATFRLIRPVPAGDGRWVVSGWSAWTWLRGRVVAGAWRETLAVAGELHQHLAAVKVEPPWRSHPWALGDRLAWGEADVTVAGPLGDVAQQLLEHRSTVDLRSQVVHGDLLNNVLFDEHLTPAVIDVSPYWRPARYAAAIVVVDAIGWGGAGDDAAATFGDVEGRQLLLRATLFRLASAVLLVDGDMGRLASQVPVYRHLAALTLGR